MTEVVDALKAIDNTLMMILMTLIVFILTNASK